MGNAKWYIRCDIPQDDNQNNGYAVIQLTDDEYKTVNNGSGCTGGSYIINHGFNTKEEALDAISSNTLLLY